MIKLDDREQKLGTIWFFIAGPVALVFVLFLARVDLALTYSTGEQERAATMRELRMAQTSLSKVNQDDRNSSARTSSRGPVLRDIDESEYGHGHSDHH